MRKINRLSEKEKAKRHERHIAHLSWLRHVMWCVACPYSLGSYGVNFAAPAIFVLGLYVYGPVNSTQRAFTTIHAKPCFNFARDYPIISFCFPLTWFYFIFFYFAFDVAFVFFSFLCYSLGTKWSIYGYTVYVCVYFYTNTSFSSLWHKLNYFTLLTKFCKIFSTVAYMSTQQPYV